jgi:hypothetical protein
MKKSLTILLFLFSAMAHASPVTWTLENVLFEDGGTAYGSYTYDADINAFTNLSITTTTGSIISLGQTYTTGCYYIYCGDLDDTVAAGILGSFAPIFGFVLDGPMTNNGGSHQLLIGPCQLSCEFEEDGETFRNVISGSVSAVPIPAAVWLFGSALAGLGWLRRRQTA